MAYCPNCSQPIAANALSCGRCGADFSSKDGWKPLENFPGRQLLRPLTAEDKALGLVIVLVFLVWLPAYLFIVKPMLIPYLPETIRAYPAKFDLVPIFVVPFAVGLVAKWLIKARINERAL